MTHRFVGAVLPIAILLNPFMSGLAAAERQQSDSVQTLMNPLIFSDDPINASKHGQFEQHSGKPFDQRSQA